jgi:uncharacterized protein (TIGR02246 family)
MTLSRLVILSGMISGLAISAPAQEAPQSVVTGVDATNSRFVQDWNKHDPAAIAGTFTPNALFVAPPGSFVGRQGVQQYYDKLFATVHPASNFTHDIDRVEMLSNELAMVTGHWHLADPPAKGFWSAVYEHQGTAWPMRAHTYNIAPPASATQTTSKP